MSVDRILVVVLHYGSEEDTNECLLSLPYEDGIDVVLVDNDPSQSYVLSQVLANKVKIIRTEGNLGFSEANNLGVKASLGEEHGSILILNNDTTVTEGALKVMKETLASPNIGLVGPNFPFHGVEGESSWACGGYINQIRLKIGALHAQSNLPFEVDYLPGAAILCRSEVWESVGGLPNRYFLAYEEAEFAMEVKRIGYKVVACPLAKVTHKVGMSRQRKPEYFYNHTRNQFIFGDYLYGRVLGFFIAFVNSFIEIRGAAFKDTYSHILIWTWAVYDSLKGAPLNRFVLNKVARRFSVK